MSGSLTDTSRFRASLRTRVALLVAVAVGFAVAAAAVAAYLTVRHELRSNLDSNLRQRAEAAARQSVYINSGPGNQQLVQILSAVAAGVQVEVIDSENSPIAYSALLPLGAPEIAVANGIQDASARTIVFRGAHYRVVAVPVRDDVALVLAQSLADTDHELGRMALVMFIVGIAGIVVAASAGLAIARAGLRPVERLTAATERVARTDDLRPIPVQGDDELARLTASFNGMLAALAQSRERQRQLIADAGHELRTPLTSLRTNLDLLAQVSGPDAPPLDPAEHAELLADVRAQIEELSSLVGDLVELARGDAPGTEVAPMDLANVLDRAIERVRRRAPGLRFDVSAEPWVVFGDAAALERAMTNLLDNAAKFSPPGGTVTVRLGDGVLQVADQGPGIAPEDRAHVFDRFYRATRARGLPGSGLGLAIVRQAAERHGGFVRADEAPGGGALLTLGVPGQPPVPEPTAESAESAR